MVSRSVAQDQSQQVFYPKVTGNARCFGHVQCDSIIMGDARISSIPAIRLTMWTPSSFTRRPSDASQATRLQEAEEKILDGFLQ